MIDNNAQGIRFLCEPNNDSPTKRKGITRSALSVVVRLLRVRNPSKTDCGAAFARVHNTNDFTRSFVLPQLEW